MEAVITLETFFWLELMQLIIDDFLNANLSNWQYSPTMGGAGSGLCLERGLKFKETNFFILLNDNNDDKVVFDFFFV